MIKSRLNAIITYKEHIGDILYVRQKTKTYVDILGKVCQEKGIPILGLLELMIDEFTEEMLKELVGERREKRGG